MSFLRNVRVTRQVLALFTVAFLLLQPTLLVAQGLKVSQKPKIKTEPKQSGGVLRKPGKIGGGGPLISLTTLGVPVTQNFDTLATSGTTNPWADDTTLTGWYSQFELNAANPTVYIANSGGTNNGAIYSFGVAGTNPVTERAFGSASSGTPGTIFNAVKLTNNTGSTVTSLDISFNGEQWRNGGNVNAQTLAFQYQVANAGTITDANTPTTGWTAFNSLNFVTPITGAAIAALDGNAAANRTAKSANLAVTVNNGQEVWLRWVDINDSGNDHGVSIDDFSVTPQGAGGGGASLSISDVTQAETNAGTTTFTFNVTLSQAAGGPVTFDIATADGTAQDDNPGTEDNDYVAQSLTGQSIPSGTGPYQFNVTVNGDGTSEPNETFFVNVTNISGATAGDPQGLGTITNDDIIDTPIHDVQGPGAASPFVGQVVTVRGIVTLLRTSANTGTGSTASGFFIQEPDAQADADPNSSEGIFVFTSSVPTYTGGGPTLSLGHEAVVTGTVAEFNGLTEINAVSNITFMSTGNLVPTAITLTTTDLPGNASGQPQLEKYESMRVTAPTLTTVAPNDSFFDVYCVLPTVPRSMREPGIEFGLAVPPDPTSGTPDPNIPIWDLNPERIKIDTNGMANSPNTAYTSNVTFTSLSGPLDYAFNEYRMIPFTAPATPIPGSANMTAVPVPLRQASEFTIAGFNIENFNNGTTQRQKAALGIRDIMRLPDIIGVIEIFDLASLQALATEINSIAPGVNYTAHLIPTPVAGITQNVGYLVNTNRVTVDLVTQERTSDTYIDPANGNPDETHDRPPLVLRARVDPTGVNYPVIVVVNHPRSFIDIELVAGAGPTVRAKRKAQAESIAGLLQELQTNNPTTAVIAVGDYNSYQFNSGYDDSIAVMKGSPTADDQIVVDASADVVNPNFSNLIDNVPADQRYTFIFEGTPQALDHVLVNTIAQSRNTGIAIAHMNADFPAFPASAFESNAAIPEGNSDHDAPVAYFTLAVPATAGQLIISEFRVRGPNPNGAENEFVEIYNNSGASHTVQDSSGGTGYAIAASDGTARCVIPNGTVIPDRGHYLCTNSVGYSLTGYAAGDQTYILDIPDNAGIALFNTSVPANFTLANRLDAVGSTSEANTLYKEGTGYPALTPFSIDYSFYRDMCGKGGSITILGPCPTGGSPKDTNNNAADLVFVDTNGTSAGAGQRLGAPGPENLASPIQRTAALGVGNLDTTVAQSAPPNRVRDFTSDPPNNSTFGTIEFRKRLVNNTGGPVTRLRFRVVDLTTFPAPSGFADLRVRTSTLVVVSGINDAGTCLASNGIATTPCTVNVEGTTLEQPPSQLNGGGFNSTLSAGTITLGTPLAPGASVNVRFLLGIQQTGTYKFFINIEALP